MGSQVWLNVITAVSSYGTKIKSLKKYAASLCGY